MQKLLRISRCLGGVLQNTGPGRRHRQVQAPVLGARGLGPRVRMPQLCGHTAPQLLTSALLGSPMLLLLGLLPATPGPRGQWPSAQPIFHLQMQTISPTQLCFSEPLGWGHCLLEGDLRGLGEQRGYGKEAKPIPLQGGSKMLCTQPKLSLRGSPSLLSPRFTFLALASRVTGVDFPASQPSCSSHLTHSDTYSVIAHLDGDRSQQSHTRQENTENLFSI